MLRGLVQGLVWRGRGRGPCGGTASGRSSFRGNRGTFRPRQVLNTALELLPLRWELGTPLAHGEGSGVPLMSALPSVIAPSVPSVVLHLLGTFSPRAHPTPSLLNPSRGHSCRNGLGQRDLCCPWWARVFVEYGGAWGVGGKWNHLLKASKPGSSNSREVPR